MIAILLGLDGKSETVRIMHGVTPWLVAPIVLSFHTKLLIDNDAPLNTTAPRFSSRYYYLMERRGDVVLYEERTASQYHVYELKSKIRYRLSKPRRTLPLP